MEAVESVAKMLFPMVEEGSETTKEIEAFQNSSTDLEKQAENFSQGLDVLAKEVDGFFKIVLTGRDALLGNLRMPDFVTEPREQQVVR